MLYLDKIELFAQDMLSTCVSYSTKPKPPTHLKLKTKPCHLIRMGSNQKGSYRLQSICFSQKKALSHSTLSIFQTMHGSRWETGVRTPSPTKNHINTGSLSNTGPDPLKNHKDTNPAFNIGPSSAHKRNAI